ncbi:hypothetical protein OJF2_49300 [Aquisphaera giovannonii]|uniref:Uncharacterized protein n=1 Tax=Aquisphaera giovannonii TaxID=406548 RepID=A0A5B9W715_9BACT|nr:SUMF1/EgtB/PvdO family nonheme iron enzyme [Aquisphaera giovannonii]QEH36368.1 hypothetical protein OJF2_49300 [Aquisphaera giovannonii]
MDLSGERWEAVTSFERETIARALAKDLPTGFHFEAVARFELGDASHHVALFRKDGAVFALIPSAEVTLGFDPDRPWEPNPDELESWEATAEEYEIDRTIREYIAEVTLRPRRVQLPPLLIEVEAKEVGWSPVGLDDPVVREIVREHGTKRRVEMSRGGTSTRVRPGDDGQLIAERSLVATHAELSARLAAGGYRFPTSDEWEYACGAGTSTLFRWGDHAPCDRYPTDVSPAEAAWRRRWALSGGKLEPPAEGFRSDWDAHGRPNAFGLSIAADPYKWELVAEAGTTRGGDGGCTICGGVGFFLGWLTLATAYFEEHSCRHDPAEPISQGYTVGRRVLDLG